mmetsp:Transcript_17060/g.54395  ORF Transcript_17060/g.54395 Transcript_17060/m.54395 type:complete len:208 (-) Transcript_17060:137-760(-)
MHGLQKRWKHLVIATSLSREWHTLHLMMFLYALTSCASASLALPDVSAFSILSSLASSCEDSSSCRRLLSRSLSRSAAAPSSRLRLSARAARSASRAPAASCADCAAVAAARFCTSRMRPFSRASSVARPSCVMRSSTCRSNCPSRSRPMSLSWTTCCTPRPASAAASSAAFCARVALMRSATSPEMVSSRSVMSCRIRVFWACMSS